MGDLVSGQIKLGFVSTAGVLPHVRAGRLKGLAISARHRTPLAPDILTLAEAGYPEFRVELYYAMMAPARTPDRPRRARKPVGPLWRIGVLPTYLDQSA